MRANPADRLISLLRRAGIKPSDLWRKMGYKGQSSIQRYLDATKHENGDVFAVPFIKRLLPVINGAGQPPISPNEILDLAGVFDLVNEAGLEIRAPDEEIPVVFDEKLFADSIQAAIASFVTVRAPIDPAGIAALARDLYAKGAPSTKPAPRSLARLNQPT